MPAHARFSYQSGQTILILLVIMALGLTVGLLTISRSTTDTELSTKIEREARVFSANEAGVEYILKNPLAPGAQTLNTNIDGINVTAQATTALSPDQPFEYPGAINVGDTQTIWLVNHTDPNTIDETSGNPGTKITVCWGKDDSGSADPGIVAAILYKDGADYKIARGAYKNNPVANRCGQSDQDGDCFSAVDNAGANACGKAALTFTKTLIYTDFGITAPKKPLAIRLRPAFARLKLAVQPGGGTLPQQALNDTFVSARHPESGESTRIRVFQSYPAALTLFDYSVFSGQDVVHASN